MCAEWRGAKKKEKPKVREALERLESSAEGYFGGRGGG
jgi:hypothetical protein